MIKINRSFSNLAKKHRRKIKANYDLVSKLDDKINATNGANRIFYEYLKNNIDAIIENDIHYIQNTINPEIDSILGHKFFKLKDPNDKRKKLNKDMIDEVNSVFEYEKFKNHHHARYNAYDLVVSLDIKVCPYCNRQYTSTISPASKKGGTRATLDHFFLKSDYPYLALSFWNLVPSCYSCNSQLRTSREIGLHPYLKGFDKILHFYTDITMLDEFIGNSNKYFELKLKKYKKSSPNTDDFDNANKNKKVFRIEEVYQNHKDYVREIIQKAIIYDLGYSKSLYEDFSDVFNNETDARNMMLGNYTRQKDFEKRPLSKLTHDIVEELNLI